MSHYTTRVTYYKITMLPKLKNYIINILVATRF